MRAVKPLIVLGGPIHPDGMKQLEAEAQVVVTNAEAEAGMIAAAKDAEGILFRSKPDCTRSLMAACKSLKVVGRHGVGLDTVDLPAATDLGVAVVHAPGSNSNSVAEHAIMLMLALAKQAVVVGRRARHARDRLRQVRLRRGASEPRRRAHARPGLRSPSGRRRDLPHAPHGR